MAKQSSREQRWADDFIVGFERQLDAERFLGELKERLKKFGLELHSEKTRLLEFGRHAAERRKRRGLSKPETFNFLGLTHVWGKSQKGWFRLTRHTMRNGCGRFGDAGMTLSQPWEHGCDRCYPDTSAITGCPGTSKRSRGFVTRSCGPGNGP